MADVKISALPAATTPLDGTELAPIVQSGTTKRVTVANLTVGRALTASSLTLTTPLSVANGGTGITSFGTGVATALGNNTNGASGICVQDASGYLNLTSPTSRLVIQPSTTTNSAYTAFTNTGGNAFVGLDSSAGGLTSAYALNIYHGGAYPITFSTSGSERARIDASGNLLVGTTSAGAKLHIAGLTSNGILLEGSMSSSDYTELRAKFTNADNCKSAIRFYNPANAYGGQISFWTQPNVNAASLIQAAFIDYNANVVVGTAALATTATDGFLYVPTCAGTPTGTPTTYTGRAPIVVNTTNNKLYFYSGGAWRDAGP